MLFLWSIIISLGIMPYAVRYGSVRTVCVTTGDSKQYDTSIKRKRKFSDGPHTMINNKIALCNLFVATRNTWFGFGDRILFRLNCECRMNERKIQRVEHGKNGFDNGSYEGFLSCGARNRLWWSMKFTPNKVGDIVFAALGIATPKYACGAQGNAWQNTILSPVHKFLGLEGHQCCESHDTCYATCKKTKRHCDWKFRKCLYRSCKHARKWRSWTCRKAASFSSDIVDSGLANKAFKTAQSGCEHIRKQK